MVGKIAKLKCEVQGQVWNNHHEKFIRRIVTKLQGQTSQTSNSGQINPFVHFIAN